MKSDSVFKALLAINSFVALVPLIHVIYRKHTINCAVNQWCPSFIYDFALPSLLFAVGFVAARHVFVWLAAPITQFLIIRGKSSPDVYLGKRTRLSHNLFKFFYFLGVSLVAFNVLAEESFFPAELGGASTTFSSAVSTNNESVFTFSTNQSNQFSADGLSFARNYFRSSAGFQFANLYFLLAESQHSNLWETIAQVVLAMQLLSYGFMAKHLAIGSCILFSHDVCDILTSACKAFVHTTYRVTTFLTCTSLMVVFAYARLYCLGKLILQPLLRELTEQAAQELMAQTAWHQTAQKLMSSELLIFVVLLLSLYFLNMYWFSFMCKSAIIFVNSGMAFDAHAPKLSDETRKLKQH